MNANLVLQIQQSLAHHLDPPALFEAALALLPQLGADFGSILLQAEDQTIHFQSTLPGQEDMVGPAGRRFARKLISNGLEGYVMRHNRAEIVENIAADPRWYRADYVIEGCRGAVVLPLHLPKVQAKGVLALGSTQAGAFSAANLPLLETAARQIGYAIESALLYRNQLDRSTQLNLINEVSRAATSILNVNLMLTTVTQAIQRSFGFQSVGIYRLAAAPKQLVLAAFTDANGRSFSPQEISANADPFIAWVTRQGKPLVANDLKIHPRYLPTPENQGIKSKLVTPIKLGVKIVGALDLESARLDAFDPPLVAALETLSDQLAVAIENARLYDELNNSINELLALNRITQSVSASLDFQQTLTLIAEHVTSMLNVAATSVALRDDERGEVWFAAASGEGSAEVLNKRMRLGEGIVGWVARHGEPIIVPDVKKDARFFPDMDKQSGFKTHSILCVPLQTKGHLIGAIEAMNKLDGTFTVHDLNRLAALTAPAATAIENAQLYQELAQRMAQVDNLRAFNQNVIENMTAGLIAADEKGTVTVFNKAASALLGINSEDAIGESIATALAHVPQLVKTLTAPLTTRQPLLHRDMALQHWDGGSIAVTVTATPMYHADDRLSGVVGLIEDLTALKTLEAERRRLDRLATLGEMSAVVAHELRNPIAGIAAGVNYLAKKNAAPADREANQMILKEVDRVHRIVEDILLIARPLTLQTAPHAVAEIIDAVCRRHRLTLQNSGITLTADVANNLPDIVVDRARIEQVLNNLLENAIQAMPAGGTITITAQTASPGGELIIRLTDTGPGILTAEPQKIFEPFFTTKNRGTGLGLALSRRILEAHHGSINLIASDRGGAAFEIRLPANAPQSPAE